MPQQQLDTVETSELSGCNQSVSVATLRLGTQHHVHISITLGGINEIFKGSETAGAYGRCHSTAIFSTFQLHVDCNIASHNQMFEKVLEARTRLYSRKGYFKGLPYSPPEDSVFALFCVFPTRNFTTGGKFVRLSKGQPVS